MLTSFIAAFLKPLPVAFVFILISLLTRKRLKLVSFFLMLTALSVLLIFSSPIMANRLLQSLESKYPSIAIKDLPKAEALILLSGGLELPHSPRQAIELGSRGDRLRLAHAILKADPSLTLILAGGKPIPNNTLGSEPDYVEELFKQWGIQGLKIITEDDSGNTSETADNLVPLIISNNISSALVVTSAYHMPRSIQLLSKLNITLTPVPANYLAPNRTMSARATDWFPNSVSLSGSALAIHEYTAMLFNKIK